MYAVEYVFEFLNTIFSGNNTEFNSTDSSSEITTPFLIVFVKETPEIFGTIKTVFFIGTKVEILSFSGDYCLVKRKDGTKGYVYKGWLKGGKDYDLSLTRSYEHVYIGGNNIDSNTGEPRTKAVYNGGGTVVWSTDNEDVISVDPKTGLVTGKKAGVANLIATVGTKKKACPVYCIYKWKKSWTGEANTSAKIYVGTSSSTATLATMSSGTKFYVKGDCGTDNGWAYGYASIDGVQRWGFVEIGNISTKGTVSQYNNLGWVWPVKNEIDGVSQSKSANYISSPYAPRSDSTSSTIHHRGIDITTGSEGEIKKYTVVSAMSGTVKAIRQNFDNCGYCISISSDSIDPVTGQKIAIIYMHLYEIPRYSDGTTVKLGDVVKAGTVIGKVGNTNSNISTNMGYHLHFETNNKNASVGESGRNDFTNTINPLYYYMDKSIRINENSEACVNGYGPYWYNKNK